MQSEHVRIAAVVVVALAAAVGIAGGVGGGTFTLFGSDDPPEHDVPVDIRAAIAAASTESDGTVVEVELFSSRAIGSPVWEVEFVVDDETEREVFVDATTGEVQDVRTESVGDDQDVRPALSTVAIDAGAAIDAAEEAAGGRTIELELSDDDGRPVWDAEVAEGETERDVVVDATDGRVLDVRED
jgi:uncharacterized membrane protein YkoI